MFEYWTHALSYVPTRDIRFFLARHAAATARASTLVRHGDDAGPAQSPRAASGRTAPLTIRDIDDDVLVEKNHPWASRKPSKRALQLAFYKGVVTISQRVGMLKTYELMDRHFGWERAAEARVGATRSWITCSIGRCARRAS